MEAEHIKEPKYVCGECRAGILCKTRLEETFTSTHGEKPFSCATCKSRFVTSRTLENHIKAAHKKQKKTLFATFVREDSLEKIIVTDTCLQFIVKINRFCANVEISKSVQIRI